MYAYAFHKQLILVLTLLLFKKQIKNNLFPVRIIITSLFYKMFLVHRTSALLNSLSAYAVTCSWKCFDVEIVISWPNWKQTDVAFIGSLIMIATSKRCLFFAQIWKLFHRIFYLIFSILNSGNFRLKRRLIRDFHENHGATGYCSTTITPDHFPF